MASVFTKIMAGELPCYKIYEDAHTFAFLALDQVQAGHTLVVPKVEVNHFQDTPEPHFSAVFQTAKRLTPAILKTAGSKRVGVSIVGLEVAHFHLHLIPINEAQDMDFGKAKRLPPDQMKSIQEKILSFLK